MREKTATEKSVVVFVIYGKYFLQIYVKNVMMSKMEYKSDIWDENRI